MTKNIRVKSICCLFCILLLDVLISCGTAHHFLPPQPLEEKEWQVSVSWHYNFNSFSGNVSTVIPDVFTYYGLSDETVLGTGISYIFLPTFVSLVNYQVMSSDKYRFTWVHFKLFNFHDNPVLDFGIGYSKKDRSTYRMVQLGVGLGYNYYPLQDKYGTSWTPRFSSKLSLVGRDAGINIDYQSGVSKFRIKSAFPNWPTTTDTIASFLPGEIIELVDNGYYFGREWKLIHKSGDTTKMYGARRYPDMFVPNYRFTLVEWVGDSTHFVAMNNDWAVINFSELREKIENGKAITITRTSQSYVDRTEKMNMLNDISLGWVVFGRPN